VFATAQRALSGYSPVQLSWAVSGVVLLRTEVTYYCCLALGSYIAVSLALEALLHAALSLISLALEHLALPDKALVNDLVCVVWSSELNRNSQCSLSGSVSSQPSYVADLSLRDKQSVVLQDLAPVVFEPVHVHRTSAYAVSEHAVRRDLYASAVANAHSPVVCKLPQCFDFSAGGCLNTQVAALQLVRGHYLHAYNVLVAALLNRTLDVGFEVA
jgi:hypothetical protein